MSSVSGIGTNTREQYTFVSEEPEGGQCSASASSPTASASGSRAHSSELMSPDPDASEPAKPEGGTAELLKKHQGRDLSGFLSAARHLPQNQSSPDQGTQDIHEYDPRYGESSHRSIPSSAVAHCNEGKSYCDADGNIVKHTVAEERSLLDEYGSQYDARNYQTPEPAQAPEGPPGTLSVGASTGVCAAGQCVGVTAEATWGANGSQDVSVGGYFQASLPVGAPALSVDRSLHVKVTNARDASEVANGTELSTGVQVGAVGVDRVQGETYEGFQATYGDLGIGLRGSASRTYGLDR